jgi:hypothetical protein
VPANTIDGGQAEYVRVPLANTTLVKTPSGKLSSCLFGAGFEASLRRGLTIVEQGFPRRCSFLWPTSSRRATSLQAAS